MNIEIGVVMGALLTLGVFFLGNLVDGQPDDLEQQRSMYCEMVETFKTTGGEYGWPDYKGTYKRDCQ